jgi:thiazole/oxazole-forming peptide maturase SagD family component
MKVVHYPFFASQLKTIRKIFGQHSGILESYMISPCRVHGEPSLLCITGKMPNYHKMLLDPSIDVQYHLSGYGTSYEECIIKFIGEGIERYALMVAPTVLEDEIIYTTYRQIERQGEDVIPFEYMTIYSDASYSELEKLPPPSGLSKPSKDDVIGWIKCSSLFRPNHDIWMPAQSMFVGYKRSIDHGEKRCLPGFSTGTASYTSPKEALLSAILEWIEIDSFIVRWYTKKPSAEVIIDDTTILANYEEILGRESNYNILPLYYTLPDLPIHVFGVFMMRKKQEVPYILFGSQGHLDPVAGFYRALMESSAITYLGVYGYLFMPAEYIIDVENRPFTDLDSNVAFYAHPTRIQEKKALLDEMTGNESIPLSSLENQSTGDVDTDLGFVIETLSKVSKYAVYRDITPPEIADSGLHVLRVFIPELCNMCMPGFPFTNHPRLNKYGGVQNEYPHPLP